MPATLAALSAALLLPIANGPPAPSSNAVAAFLRAADASNAAAMTAVMDRGSAGFLKAIDHCYLRAVYSKEATHEIVAAWMCAEGPNRSKLVLADVAPAPAGKVSVSIRHSETNNRPAPPRTKSAFGK